jgi:hypothetical protein
MTTPLGQYVPTRGPRAHTAQRLDVQIARAAVGWSIWSDTDLDQVADQLLALAGGNRTALERALRRFHRGESLADPTPDRLDTTVGRAAAALRLALARGSWAW